MKDQSSAIHPIAVAVPPAASGLGWGFLGVLAFSLTVPLTRVAVTGGSMSPLFVGSARAVVAGVLAALLLALTAQRLPSRTVRLRLTVVAGGVVVGFPVLTSFALTAVPAGHGAVLVALLPAATALMVVVRTGERPRPAFWVAAGVGAVAAATFAAVQNGGVLRSSWADLLLFGAVAAAAVGYAEGGLVAREIGAWQTVSWALVLALPVMSTAAAAAWVAQPPSGGPTVWASFAYLGVVSMFLGFFAWYRGLAVGPMAQVSQVQLVQPVLSLGWAALLLGEHLGAVTVVGAAVIVACAGSAVRVRLGARTVVGGPAR